MKIINLLLLSFSVILIGIDCPGKITKQGEHRKDEMQQLRDQDLTGLLIVIVVIVVIVAAELSELREEESAAAEEAYHSIIQRYNIVMVT